MIRVFCSFSRFQATLPKKPLRTHDIKHEYLLTVVTVEDPARGLNNLAIAGALQLRWLTAAVWVGLKLLHMTKYPLYQLRSRNGVLYGDVVRDGSSNLDRASAQ